MKSPTLESAIEIVNKQLDAYNKRDFAVFASCYEKEIVSYDLNTSKLMEEMSGACFFEHYARKFQENPQIDCTVTERMIVGNFVIDKELIANYQNSSHEELVIYQVENGLISKMWFKR